MRRLEFVPIATFKYDASTLGTLSAGNKWDRTKSLEDNQVAEISHVEIFAPVKDDGTYEDLRRVIPIIDGKILEDLIALPGKYDLLFTPPWNGVVRWRFRFGEPGVRDPRRNTTLKAVKKVGVRAFAGSSDVTSSFMIRFWGYLYEEEETVIDTFGERIYGEETRIYEDIRGKSLSFTKPEVEVSMKNFDKLVGGINQDSPKVMPFAKFAKNNKATTANELYEFKKTDDYVAEDWENMFFDASESEAYIIRCAGVRAVTNLEGFGLKIGTEEFPRGLYPADPDTNRWHFGLADVQGYSSANWFGIPYLELGGYVIHNEKGRIVVRDNGTSIAAGQIYVACSGWQVTEM